MEKETYIILRMPTHARPESFDPLDETVWRGAEPIAKSVEPTAFHIESETLDRRDLHDLRRDPEGAGLAPPIPVKLIKPVADPALIAEPPHMDGVTWGVFVTGALQSDYTGHGVTVAVLDTGIDATHEAFQGVELIQQDFTGEGDGDTDGHGTHVAGTIFGQAVKGLRYSVAPGIRRALIGKVLGKNSGTTQGIVEGIQWAVKGGAQVINM